MSASIAAAGVELLKEATADSSQGESLWVLLQVEDGTPYFYNSSTEETTWNLQPPWEAHFDEDTSDFYFFNPETGGSTWSLDEAMTAPTPAPPAAKKSLPPPPPKRKKTTKKKKKNHNNTAGGSLRKEDLPPVPGSDTGVVRTKFNSKWLGGGNVVLQTDESLHDSGVRVLANARNENGSGKKAGSAGREKFTKKLWEEETTGLDEAPEWISRNDDVKSGVKDAAGVSKGGDKYRAVVTERSRNKFHSLCRWDKSSATISDFVDLYPGVEDSRDPLNGNAPIHIAAQNGHYRLVKQLIDFGVDVNAQNKSGNSALHMARAYDYFWVSRYLLKHGANPGLKNKEGIAANTGLSGDKGDDDFVAALAAAHNKSQLNEALCGLETQAAKGRDNGIDKAELVMAGMKKKKEAKVLWRPEVNTRFRAICNSL